MMHFAWQAWDFVAVKHKVGLYLLVSDGVVAPVYGESEKR